MDAFLTPEHIRERLQDPPFTIPGLDLMILFGSHVRGSARANSDVDLAVKGAGAVDLDRLFLALAPRLRTLHVDLVDLNHAGPLLAFEVARSGVLLHEGTPGLFREFQSLAYRRYVDSAGLREARRRAIQVFLAREGLA